MKTFYLVTANDKSRHLYVWDSDLKTMELVTSAVWAHTLADSIYIVEDLQGRLKVVVLYNSVIHEFEPPTKDIKIVCKHCIWRIGDAFCGYDYATGKIKFLGAYNNLNVSIQTMCSLEETAKCYFVQKNDDGTQKLIFIRADGIIEAGNYVKIETGGEDFLLAFKDDVYCDIYKPTSPYICKPIRGRSSSFVTRYAFYWQETEECWACLGIGLALASNAFQTSYLKDGKVYAILYRVEGIEKKVVVEGKWENRDDTKVATCINGIEYHFEDPNAFDRVVDFDNLHPIPKKFLGLF